MSVIASIGKRLRGEARRLIALGSGARISISTVLWAEGETVLRTARGAVVNRNGTIHLHDRGSMTLGAGSIVMQGCEIIVMADGRLTIGRNVYLGAYVNIRCNGQISIGENVRIAQFVSIIDADYDIHGHHRGRETIVPEHIVVGSNAWIGAHAVLLPGIVVGEGAVVGAGSIVTKNIPPNSVWAGNPARPITTR